MRLSSSLNGTSKGEAAPLTLALEYFDRLGLPCGILLEDGLRTGRVAVSMVDFADFGVGVSMLLNSKLCCLWVLACTRGLGLISEFGLGGVSWKFFMAEVSGVLAPGSWRSNQFHHHGNPPDLISARDVWADFGVDFHNCWPKNKKEQKRNNDKNRC